MSIGQFRRLVGPVTFTVAIEGASGDATGAATGPVTVVNGGYGYVTGDLLTVTGPNEITGTGIPTGLELYVDGVSTTGVITSLALSVQGFSTATGSTVTGTGAAHYEYGDGSGYVNHSLYEVGGNISEYPLGIGAGNDSNNPPYPTGYSFLRPTGNLPTIKTFRTADQPQKEVQARTVTSGGVTVTVYAEPNVVRNGEVRGTTVRAEDILDANRCTGLGFIWEQVAKVTGLREAYGYCREVDGGDVTDAAADTDCPVGFKYDSGTGCTGIVIGDVTGVTIGDVTGGMTGNGFTNDENAVAAGFLYGYDAGEYFDPRATGNIPTYFSVTGITNLFSTTGATLDRAIPMGKVELAKTLCRYYGFVWNKTTNACEEDNSASYVAGSYGGSAKAAKDACVAAGYVWLAGACFNPNLFGDGQARMSDQADALKLINQQQLGLYK